MYSEDNHSLAIAKDFLNANHENKKTNKHRALIAAIRCKCFFCGRAYHDRKYFPAISTTCFFCVKIVDFSRLFKSSSLENVEIYKSNWTVLFDVIYIYVVPKKSANVISIIN